MTREEILQKEFVDDMLQWSAERIYNTFGSWLETIVNQQKEQLQIKLKTIWRNRKWYAFNDTAEQFDDDTMLIYFNVKKIKAYSLSDLEMIIEKLDNETIYSNPKKSISTDQ